MIFILVVLNLLYIYIYNIVILKGYFDLFRIITRSISINIPTSFYKVFIRVKISYKAKANTNLTPT